MVVPRVVPHILKERYFASDEFLTHKGKIATVVAEHNEVARYVSEIRSRGSFSLSVSSTGTQAHLASFQLSQVSPGPERCDYQAPNVHNCSLQVVRNASADPVKYVMKYFNIKADEANLTNANGWISVRACMPKLQVPLQRMKVRTRRLDRCRPRSRSWPDPVDCRRRREHQKSD